MSIALAGAGHRRGRCFQSCRHVRWSTSSRAVSDCPPPRTSTHRTCSTADDVDARARRAKRGEKVLARRRRAAATPRASGPLVGGQSSEPHQQPRRVVGVPLAPGFRVCLVQSCCRRTRDPWAAAVSGDMAALRRRDARRTGEEDALVPGVDGISFTVHPLVADSRRISRVRPRYQRIAL